jgi:ADP-ribose pyrophosphatase YjhB (NUDIX family)
MTRSPQFNPDPFLANSPIAAPPIASDPIAAIPHFVDRQWQARSPRFLSAETYGAALSAVVIACVDVVFCRQLSDLAPECPPGSTPKLTPESIAEWPPEPMPELVPEPTPEPMPKSAPEPTLDNAQVLLTHRRREPRPGWWIVGGRMQPGESPIATAQRKIQAEAGLAIAGDRLQFVQTYSTVFGRRAQPPHQEGLHSLNLIYAVMLDPHEVGAIALDPEEYDRWEWVARSQVGDRLRVSDPLDAALAQIMTDLGMAWPRLKT